MIIVGIFQRFNFKNADTNMYKIYRNLPGITIMFFDFTLIMNSPETTRSSFDLNAQTFSKKSST